jgi:predicted phosphodiesterase
MKIAICSDLHLEFGDINITNDQNIDVLVLSGDILVENDLDMLDRRQREMGFARSRSLAFHDFFSRVCFQFPHVLYVAGNHEHYHGDFKDTLVELKRKLAHHSNLHILDKEIFKLGDTTFVGSTLWTDMNNQDPLTMYHMKDRMNDFRIIKNSNREVTFKSFEVTPEGRQIPTFRTRPAVFCPEDAVEENRKCFEYIKHIVSECPPWEQVVVIGHHTPSHQSCHPRYKDDSIMNGGYHNNYEEYILDHPQIKLWTHGHTHERYDYMIGSTRIVCNPRGYVGYEDMAQTFELKVVEI